ncbi:MAG: HAMP domain-containing sensor histidine kinase [Cyanobacteria bacterium P01_H01_bin.58]
MDSLPQFNLSDILWQSDSFQRSWESQEEEGGGRQSGQVAAEVEWRAAIAAMRQVLHRLPRTTSSQQVVDPQEGIILSGPLPVLNEADCGARFETWVVTPQPLANILNQQTPLLPASHLAALSQEMTHPAIRALPLDLQDTITTERFCLVVTQAFSIALVLGKPAGRAACLQYSFEPAVLLALWQRIQSGIVVTAEANTALLNQQIASMAMLPDYRLITKFTQLMMANLPHRRDATEFKEVRGNIHFAANWSSTQGRAKMPSASVADAVAGIPSIANEEAASACKHDIELLKAMAHEIRTPLTTIRTLTRSLMKRKELAPEVKKRLGRIDQECTQQIDRFNLIFRAVEIATAKNHGARSPLTPMALTQIFQESIPRWQQQAHRRNLSLDVTLPPNLPRVTSDPTLLDQVLTGVVEWYTQGLPAQSHIQMSVMLAGHQLKLQFEADLQTGDDTARVPENTTRQPFQSLGKLLTVAPETGGVSLNLDVTKDLFQFLGGKLIVRQRPQQSEILTVFLPLDDTREI